MLTKYQAESFEPWWSASVDVGVTIWVKLFPWLGLPVAYKVDSRSIETQSTEMVNESRWFLDVAEALDNLNEGNVSKLRLT